MAVTVTVAEIAATIGFGNTAAITRMLAYASGEVLRYAPLAGDPQHNEAVIRICGYLAESNFGGIQAEAFGPRPSPSFLLGALHCGPPGRWRFCRHTGAGAQELFRCGCAGPGTMMNLCGSVGKMHHSPMP